MQNSPAQLRGIFHRAYSSGIRRKHLHEDCESKRSRAIPVHCKSERRAPEALRGALHRLCGNSHLLRPMRAPADNSDRRKKTHRPASQREPRASLDSELVAASLRIEFVSLLASYCYATPATRSRQLERRRTFRKANASVTLAVRVFIDHHFAGERAIDVSKISCCQDDSEEPPGQSYFQTIVSGFCRRHRQRIQRIPRGQDQRIHAKDKAGEHTRQVCARCEERFALIAFSQFKEDACYPRHRKQRKNESPRPGREIFFYLWLDAERYGSHQCRKHRDAPPRMAG